MRDSLFRKWVGVVFFGSIDLGAMGGCAVAQEKMTAAMADQFRYDEVVTAMIGASGGVLANADRSIVVTIPPLSRDTACTLSFRKNSYPARSGMWAPVIFRLMPDD